MKTRALTFKKFNFVVILTILLLSLSFGIVAANDTQSGASIENTGEGQETCPTGPGWKKIEDVNSQSKTVTADAGYEIVETCYKAGTTVVHDGPFDGVQSYKFQSTVWNPQENAYRDISHVSYRQEKTVEEAKVEVNVGGCSWTEIGGSTSAVTLTITGASVTIKKDGTNQTWGPYTSNKTLNLAPGNYTYTWTPLDGYRCVNTNTGTFKVEDCPAASANAIPGGCTWSEASGSTTPVVITVSNASLTISGVGTYTSSKTIDLGPGTYHYTWTANNGYSGNGNGSFTLVDCEPKIGRGSVSAGACSWDSGTGSTFVATITLDNATMTINGKIYSESTEITLSCGSYPYSWTAKSGYEGSGSGSIDVEGCEPATAKVIVGGCTWNGSASMTPVTLNITGATLTLVNTNTGSTVDTYGPGSYSLSLPAGSYSYSWVANDNYTGSDSGSFETIDCEPGKADASVNIGACVFDKGKSETLVTINVSGAILTIDGQEFTGNAEIKLEPGSYDYSWVAAEGYEGGGNGTIDVESCEPAVANVGLGACGWIDETSLTPVTLTINGATLTLFDTTSGTMVQIETYGPGNHSFSLPVGSYAYTWVANEGFTGSGEGTFTTLDCEPGKADASVSIGACTYSDETSLTLISINVNNAVLTINNQEFIESAELKLEPGEYAYSWTSIEGYQGEGSGILTVGSCDPKSNEDPSPDFAAGGEGPSLVATLTPMLLTAAGIGATWLLLKRKFTKNN